MGVGTGLLVSKLLETSYLYNKEKMETFTKKEPCKIINKKLTKEERRKLIETKPSRKRRGLTSCSHITGKNATFQKHQQSSNNPWQTLRIHPLLPQNRETDNCEGRTERTHPTWYVHRKTRV